MQIVGWGFASNLSKDPTESNIVELIPGNVPCTQLNPRETNAFNTILCEATVGPSCSLTFLYVVIQPVTSVLYPFTDSFPPIMTESRYPDGHQGPNSQSSSNTILTPTNSDSSSSSTSLPVPTWVIGVGVGAGSLFTVMSSAIVVSFIRRRRSIQQRRQLLSNIGLNSVAIDSKSSTKQSRTSTLTRTLYTITQQTSNPGFAVPGHLLLDELNIRVLSSLTEGGGGNIYMGQLLMNPLPRLVPSDGSVVIKELKGKKRRKKENFEIVFIVG